MYLGSWVSVFTSSRWMLTKLTVTSEYVKVGLSAAWPVYICLWIQARLVCYCKPLSIWYVCDMMSLCSFCFTYSFTCYCFQAAEVSFHIQINCLQNVWRVCVLLIWGVLFVCVLLLFCLFVGFTKKLWIVGVFCLFGGVVVFFFFFF